MSENAALAGEEVIKLIKKKDFVEPAIVKYEESLDKVTLNFNGYPEPISTGGDSSTYSGNRGG